MAKKVTRNKSAKEGTRKSVPKSLAIAGHPDQRLPVHGDPDHEILCKWIAASNGYQCRQVPTGGDWDPQT